ncbi:MAG: lamin tail domain-containing protein [Planctomycetes bacterium]|nr:lamin tail domain-containing protein [Planctomycetota bacterium]
MTRTAHALLFFFLAAVAAAGIARADSTVVFNEVMYHPPGNEALLEWVELHNPMAVDMDISGWSLSDGVFFVFPEETIIPGGEYLVVAASPGDLQAAGFAGALGPFEGRLDNSGETLTLLNNNGRVMDELRYRDSGAWPAAADGSGASLAKVHGDLPSAPAASWTHSARVGGTPGERNFDDGTGSSDYPRELISYWSLDQPSGSFADVAGGNNGTAGSGATRVAGIVGTGAVSFNNTSNAFINVGSGSATSFSTTTGITVEALIRPEWSGASGDQDEVFRKEDGANRILLSLQNDGNGNGLSLPAVGPGPVLSFGLNVGGTYTELDMLLDGQEGRPSLADLKDGDAHHAAAVYDSATGLKALYLDGALAFKVELTRGSLIASGGSAIAYIGNMSGRGEPFTGVIDEVAVWKKALSAAEVAQHYARARAGKSYFEAEQGPPTGEPPVVAFNETFASGLAESWVELTNGGREAVELKDHAVRSLVLATERVLPAGSLAPGGFLVLSEGQLGFKPAAGDTLFLFTPDRGAVLAAVRVEDGLRGRRPDATGDWLFPDRPTPGAANSFRLRDEVVVNEILYHHRGADAGGVFRESAEAWIELYNRSGGPVDLTGWSLDGGIEYPFPDGTVIAAGEHLVVAADAAALQALYPAIRVLGNFAGRLSHKSDRIRLVDSSGNPADDVRYFDGGRWPDYADGGGSSLELRDPRADNSRAEAWAASDEGAKTTWKAYAYRMTAQANIGPTRWNELVMGLLDSGEALIDDVHVVETPATAPKELIQNSTFDAGTDKWRMLGNHSHSFLEADEADPAGKVLHLVATGPTEHMHNHLETTYAGNVPIANGRQYEVSFRARWLGGSNQVNTRLYFNRCPETMLLDVPAQNGTPGARNSRFEANIGPTFGGFRHSPVAPAPSQPVTVSVTAEDPDGVGGVTLFYSVNGGAWVQGPMAHQGGGLYQGTIPAQAAGALVQLYAEAVDLRGAKAAFPAKGPGSRALYRVQDGTAVLGRVHNVRILMTAADTNLIHLETNVMSNDRLGATIVYDEREAFYDAGVRLKGSERGRNQPTRVGFNIRFAPDRLFRGVHERIDVDRSGGWGIGVTSGHDEIVVKHMIQHAGGIPGMYDDIIRVIAPRPAQTGTSLLIMAGFQDVFLDSQFENGSEGQLFELELIYYPTSTVGGVEALKRPEPDDVLGADFRDHGSDKEIYRWNFLIDNHRDRDDYSSLMALCRAFGASAATLDAATQEVMDVEQWMRAFAMTSLCGVNDAYTRGNNHNLVVYFRPEDGLAMAFPWDNDFCWSISTSSSLWGDQNLSRIIQLGPNRRLFYAHLLDILATTYNTTYMGRWITHYSGLAGQSWGAVTSYMTQRSSFAKSAIPAKVPFAITTQNGEDFTVETQTVVIDGNAWFDARFILLEGEDAPLEPAWPSITKWRATVPLQGGPNLLRFVALDLQGNPVGSDSITVTWSTGPVVPRFIRGDVNLDRSLDLADVLRLLFHLYLGAAIGCEDSGDATNNEILDVADAIFLLNYLFRAGAAPSAPFPSPGEDTGSTERLDCERGV